MVFREVQIIKYISKKAYEIRRPFWLTGAGEEIRTLDPNLGKVMLYPWATPASVSEAEVALEAFPRKG